MRFKVAVATSAILDSRAYLNTAALVLSELRLPQSPKVKRKVERKSAQPAALPYSPAQRPSQKMGQTVDHTTPLAKLRPQPSIP